MPVSVERICQQDFADGTSSCSLDVLDSDLAKVIRIWKPRVIEITHISPLREEVKPTCFFVSCTHATGEDPLQWLRDAGLEIGIIRRL